ncbi:MAG: preprotein translocase subunit TatC [Phycisphaeraceae bacterium]|nr:preprotein translocase subunit TatC [Phycisphaeraceae bacterium]
MLGKAIQRKNREATMGLGEHLEELRRRLLWCIVGLVPIFVGALLLGDRLLDLMIRPVLRALREEGLPATLQATGVLETFMAWFKVSLIATVVVGGPWILYQVWKFVAPGLYSNERRFAYVLAPLSAVLTVAGITFMYWVMLPAGLAFLVHFGNDLGAEKIETAPVPEGVVIPMWPVLKADPTDARPGQVWINETVHEIRVCVGTVTDPSGKQVPDIRGAVITRQATIAQQYRVREYVDLFFGLALAFAVAFQLPVVVLLLGWIGIVTPKGLGTYRKHAFFLCAVVGAVLTPTPDPLSMTLLMVPMYLLYEAGIILLRLLPASRVAGARAEANAAQGDAGPANDADSHGP